MHTFTWLIKAFLTALSYFRTEQWRTDSYSKILFFLNLLKDVNHFLDFRFPFLNTSAKQHIKLSASEKALHKNSIDISDTVICSLG